MAMQHVEHPLPPLFDEHSKILILGTMPSVKSREAHFYYANPRNRFWTVVSTLLGEKLPREREERKEMLLRHGVALYDVLAACEIDGSADTTIREPRPSDLSGILGAAEIRMVFTNGKKAYELYQKYLLPQTGRECMSLKSTSPANAAAGMDDLLRDWQKILDYLDDSLVME